MTTVSKHIRPQSEYCSAEGSGIVALLPAGDRLFPAICTPPFQRENYEDIEELIGSERNPRRKP